MSSVHVVELASVPPQPWRNGGGQTRELLAWPVGGSDWQLRVSVADIDHDGPFSAFPGVARCFTVLEGAGVVLGFAGHDHTLTMQTSPLAFDGVDAPACRLIDGPTRDLNLMGLHTAGAVRMLPAATPGWLPARPGQLRWRGLFTAQPLRLQVAGAEWRLPAASLTWADGAPAAGPWRLHAAGEGALRAWEMLLEARP
jgi:uncharacterized protein